MLQIHCSVGQYLLHNNIDCSKRSILKYLAFSEFDNSLFSQQDIKQITFRHFVNI